MKLQFILTETAADKWIRNLREAGNTGDALEYYEGTIGDFDRGLKALFGIQAAWHIEQQHVVAYYFKYQSYLKSGIMTRRQVPHNLFGFRSQTEIELQIYMQIQLSVVKRFLAFCWSQEYIGKDFPRWRWTDDEFERLSIAYRNGC